MRFGVDIRGLSPHRAGKGRYAAELLNALREVDQKNEYVLYGGPTSELFDMPSRWQARILLAALVASKNSRPERLTSTLRALVWSSVSISVWGILLADAMASVLSDADLSARLSQSAKRRFAECFNQTRETQETITVYNSWVNG